MKRKINGLINSNKKMYLSKKFKIKLQKISLDAMNEADNNSISNL